MNYRHISLPALLFSLLAAMAVSTQAAPPPDSVIKAGPPSIATGAAPSPSETMRVAPQYTGQPQTFAFEGAPLELVMEQYCQWTGKIYLKTDAVTASITLKAERLTTEESIKVVEAILAMNNIALVPMGDRYLKVVQATAGDLVGHGLTINTDQDTELEASERFITQVIRLENAGITDVQAAVQHVMHAYGKMIGLPKSNSLMITDTKANIIRVREIIDFIDQATAKVESRIYEIQYADAAEISQKLNEIVLAAQETGQTTGGRTTSRAPAGVIRARQAQTARNAPAPAVSSGLTDGGHVSMIHGTVKVMADERTNIIIIFSQPENFVFFDQLIKVLDVEVEPAINFEVVNLEYADAEELSGTLNELVGAAQSTRSTSTTGTSRTPAGVTRARPTTSTRTPTTGSALNNLSYLSESTKILADSRSNSILLMGKKTDIEAIKNVIKSLDVMLEQVLIEAAIFEITLNDNLQHGIKWFYDRVASENTAAGWGGNALSLLGNLTTNLAPTADNLTYFQTFTDIDLSAAVRLMKTDNNSKLLSTPVVMTTDNTEATITIGEQRPIVTATQTTTTSVNALRSQYEYKDIGIKLTVTPRINPQRFVVMEINQKADQIAPSDVIIDGNAVPIILNREIEASIAVPDRGTIALGGLITTDEEDEVTKIPILGDIPLIGRYLFSSVEKTDIRRELIVLMTPYVLTTPEEMLQETERLYKGLDLEQEDWPAGQWSKSQLQHISDDQEEPELPAYEQKPVQSENADMQQLLQEMSEQ